MQAGSSIMPGKVNPVIPEVVNQVAFEVIGNDVTVTMAAEAGQLQLNAFEPIIAAQPVQEPHPPARRLPARWPSAASTASPPTASVCARVVEHSIGLVTALNPLHRLRATPPTIAQEALATGRSVYELVLEQGLLTQEQLDELLQPEVLTQPRSFTVTTVGGEPQVETVAPKEIG